MSLIGTPIKDSSKLAFGLATLYLGDSAANISTTTPVLSSADSIGSVVKVSVNMSKEFIEIKDSYNGVGVLLDLIKVGADFNVQTTFIENSQENLALSFGGDGTETDILEAFYAEEKELRAELVFTYPNKINTMSWIFPIVKIITKTLALSFNGEDPLKTPLQFSPLLCSNAAWDTYKCGRVIFA